jgi:hypothetical protein
MKIYEEIFAHPSLVDRPPVLIDIGASTNLPDNWKAIAQYSVCIAFDPDDRQMDYIKKESGYKELFIYPKIVHESNAVETDFYLTASPECSSTLPPILDNVKNYYYSSLFAVDKQMKMPAITIPQVLEELHIEQIDWFKSDTQGTDLRIYKSIPTEIRHKIVTVELEPSIVDTYEGEDKICDVLRYLDVEPFWCSSMRVQVSRRISCDILERYFSAMMRKLINTVLSPAPCWAELTFFNDFCNDKLETREYLLGWVFAMEEKQYGYAIGLAEKGKEFSGDHIFDRLKQISINKINNSVFLSSEVIKKAFKKILFFRKG